MKREIPFDADKERRSIAKYLHDIKEKVKSWHEHQTRGNLELRAKDMTDLHTWLEDQYPGVYINLNHMPKKLEYSYLISGIFLQLVVTALLAALTQPVLLMADIHANSICISTTMVQSNCKERIKYAENSDIEFRYKDHLFYSIELYVKTEVEVSFHAASLHKTHRHIYWLCLR